MDQRLNLDETPALTATHLETCLFKTTLSYLFAKKSPRIFSKISDIPLSFNFNNKLSRQTLSKAFDMPRKAPIISQPSSNDL